MNYNLSTSKGGGKFDLSSARNWDDRHRDWKRVCNIAHPTRRLWRLGQRRRCRRYRIGKRTRTL